MSLFTDESVDTDWYENTITKIIKWGNINTKIQTYINIHGNNAVKKNGQKIYSSI